MINRPVKRIAIIDYDNCAYTAIRLDATQSSNIANSHPHYLSETLLQDVRNEEFHAFYGCTHRMTGSAFIAAIPDAEYLRDARLMHAGNYNLWNGLTTSITDHLVGSLSLPCVAVSTPDDFITESDEMPTLGCCGVGYRNYIVKFENELVRMNNDKAAGVKHPDELTEPAIPEELYDLYSRQSFARKMKDEHGKRHKNDQLRALMLHARHEFPDHDLEFVLYDDDEDICRHALEMRLYGKGISLEVRQHDAYAGTLKLKGKISTANTVKNILPAPLERSYTITIPGRSSAPATHLYIKLVTENAESLDTKPYVIVLSGGPGLNHSWYQDYKQLQSVANIIFYDPRGCGLSDKGNPDTYTMDNNIDDIEAIRQYFELDKVRLVGKSYGAMCGLGYALRYPDNVDKLVLAAGAPSHRFLNKAQENFKARQPTDEQIEVTRKLWTGSFKDNDDANAGLAKLSLFYSWKLRHGEKVSRPAPIYPCEADPLTVGFTSFLKEFDFESQLEKVACPTLILVGEEDWITDPSFSKEMAAKIPDSELIVFPKADHSMESDVPNEFFESIRKFVAKEERGAMRLSK